MSNISSKISSIEPEGEAKKGSLGLRPSGDDVPKRSNTAPVADATHTSTAPKYQEPVPEFITRPPATPTQINAPSFGWIKWTMGGLILFWIIAAVIIALAFFNLDKGLNSMSPLQMAGLAVFVLGPVCILALLGYALKQLARLSHESYALQNTAEKLMTPDDTAVSRTSLMAHNIKTEIDGLNAKVDAAISRTAKLKDTLDAQLHAIDRTSYITDNKTELIATRLTEEREALMAMASTFDERMTALSDMLDTHSSNLAKSTQDAEQKIQEARVSVEGVAAKINSASEIVRGNTLEAASTLEANQNEITRLSTDLKTRAHELDEVYRKHASDLAAMISALKDEQDNLGTSLDARLQKMREMSLSAQVSAQHLTEASEAGRHTVESLADAARLTESAVKKRFSEMEEMVRFSNARAEKISDTAARRVQDSLAQTRKEISRIEYDMVALQDRLNQKQTETPSLESGQETGTQDIQISEEINPTSKEEDIIIPTPSSPNPKKKKRKGILGLRPVADEEKLDARPSDSQGTPPRLQGLRPAPDPEDDIIQLVTEASDELSIPPLDIPPEDIPAPPEDEAPILDPHQRRIVEEERDEDTLELEFEIPHVSDLVTPDPDEEIKTFDPDLLRPTVPSDQTVRKTLPDENEKRAWWKSIFGVGKKDETYAIDQLTAPSTSANPVQAPTIEPAASPASDIVSALSALGLSPSAVVDDGCIIEAVNARVSKGPLAMSDVILHRLEDPVLHLYRSAEADLNLKDEMIAFAREFHSALGPIEDNREAIRTRLESERGRAFLLCDAALNK